MHDVHVLIAGEAGQGLVTVGSLTVKALVRAGYELLVTQDYMSRVRGGHNTFSIRFGQDKLYGPREDVDVLVALDAQSVDKHVHQLSERGVVIAAKGVETGHPRTFSVPFEELIPKKIFANTVALGVLASVICLDLRLLEELLHETFAKKGEEVVAQNIEVLHAAADWKERQDKIFECPAPSPGHGGRLAINGNECLALGALAGGCNFLSFYPMTPATSVALTIIAHAKDLGVIAEQAEDEIAAVNMALGASWAGARSLVPTSGGGFALMTEGFSLAGMTETPLVVVLAMRPGPATGLPTRTEQGDLNLALHAGHGPFPRAILTPTTPEDCFHIGAHAMGLAQRWQSPVGVLTDQFLADSYRSVAPFDLDALPDLPELLLEPENPAEYARYSLGGQAAETGVSPRAIPGFSEALVVADSDEHDEHGHITEDFPTRIAMADKRMRKLEGLRGECLAPIYEGPDEPEVLLACWGSSYGPCLEASQSLTEQGIPCAVLAFRQVYPVDPDQFLDKLEGAGKTVMVEGNMEGQLASLLHQEADWGFDQLIRRYDGLPFTATYILDQLEEHDPGCPEGTEGDDEEAGA